MPATHDVRELQRRVNLLESTVREMLRISRDSEKDAECVPPHEALEGELLKRWKNIERKARHLVQVP